MYFSNIVVVFPPCSLYMRSTLGNEKSSLTIKTVELWLYIKMVELWLYIRWLNCGSIQRGMASGVSRFRIPRVREKLIPIVTQ